MLAVACILKITNTWNDYVLGLIFAGRANLPMTVQLNNMVNSTLGEREYNMEMAATLLTVLVPVPLFVTLRRNVGVPVQLPLTEPVPSNLKTAVAAQPAVMGNVVGVPLPRVSGAIGTKVGGEPTEV